MKIRPPATWSHERWVPKEYVHDVEVPCQEHVLPTIPSGHTVRDMIKE
jgi:hypothetical protein